MREGIHSWLALDKWGSIQTYTATSAPYHEEGHVRPSNPRWGIGEDTDPRLMMVRITKTMKFVRLYYQLCERL
jgi:hypothetical protein